MRKRFLSLILALLMVLSLLPGAAMAADGGPVKSSNANRNNYTSYYAYPINSYLYENPSGGLTRVEYINNQVVIEDYDSSFHYLSGRTITPELPLWGGFFAGKDCNFLIYGQKNPNEDNNVEVIRVVKYDKDWNRLGQASLKGASTTVPFNSGSLRCDEYGGYLFIRTCHTMYKLPDGLNHQANMTIAVRQSDMTVTDLHNYHSTGGRDYVGHSFNQFILAGENGKLVALDQGDAYPRGVVFSQYTVNTGTGKFSGSGRNMFEFAGAIGQNTTGASIGGLAETSNGYVFAYNYDGKGSSKVYSDRYPYFHYVDKATGEDNQIKLDYLGSTTPVLAPTGLDGGYMLWHTDMGMHYVHYNADGQLDGAPKTTKVPLSDCQPIFYNGKVLWYATSNTAPVFYQLDSSGVTIIPIPSSDDNSYTLTFEGGTGSNGNPPAPLTKKEGDVFNLPECTLTKTGYTFVGWADNGKIYTPGSFFIMPAKNVTLTAYWEKDESNTRILTYDYGLGGKPSQQNVKAGKAIMLEMRRPDVMKEGYYADGWSDGTRRYGFGTFYTMPDRDVTLTRIWLKVKETNNTVTFEGGPGAVGTPPAQMVFDAGETFMLPANTFTREGYTFTGWGGYEPEDFFTMPSHDVTFTASWEKNVPYTVTFEGGEGAVGTAPAPKESQGNEPLMPRDNTFTKEGYIFSGWSDGIDTYVPGVVNPSYIMPAHDVIFTAQWEKREAKTYNVKYDLGRTLGSAEPPVQGATKEGTAFTLPDCENPYPEYQIFDGWKISDTGDTYKPGDVCIMPSRDVTFTAQWKDIYEKYSVTFLGGSFVHSQEVPPGRKFTLPENTLVKDGFIFIGWSDGTKVYQPGDTYTMPDHYVSFKAKWKVDDGTSGTEVQFTDVPSDAWYYDAVQWAVEQGITAGTTDTTFGPEEPCTRGQIVTFLWRAAGSPVLSGTHPFTDVSKDSYYHDAVLWAVAKGITSGTSDTAFSPDAVCTRAQAVAFLHRAGNSPEPTGKVNFTDVPAGAYYADAVRWAVAAGVTLGTTDTTFSPDTDCTRAQIVTFLHRDRAD